MSISNLVINQTKKYNVYAKDLTCSTLNYTTLNPPIAQPDLTNYLSDTVDVGPLANNSAVVFSGTNREVISATNITMTSGALDLTNNAMEYRIGGNNKLDDTKLNNANLYPSSSGQLAILADIPTTPITSSLNNVTPTVNTNIFSVYQDRNGVTAIKALLNSSGLAAPTATTASIYSNGGLLVASTPVNVDNGILQYSFPIVSTNLSKDAYLYVSFAATINPGGGVGIYSCYLS